jgi:polyhydroxybutyrate depolymerase
MKNLYLSFTLVFVVITSAFTAQLTTNSWNFGGLNRQYLTYVPASYDGTTPVPIVFCLHGLGDNMNNFYNIGMKFVADTANFIVVVPQAIVDPLAQASAWNSGASYLGYTLNGGVNDIGFINAIIDTLISNYNIDQRRVYSCGFSMGGFMTNRLGCQLSHRIAAIASVAGTIGGAVTCNPGRTVPACHFHGTLDSTVYYEGNLYGNDAEELVAFWANNNGCNASPTVTSLPDIAADDLLITHWEYTSCTNNATVEFFKVDSAEHVWLTPANDIFYTTEIWKFFMKHTHSEFVGIETNNHLNLGVTIYPNPTNGEVFIVTEHFNSSSMVNVFDAMGKLIVNQNLVSSTSKIDLSDYEKGIYFIQVTTAENTFTKKVIVE